MTRASAVLILLAVAACTAPPEVDALLGPEAEGNDYPTLMPLRIIPPPDPAPAEQDAEANAALQARAEALRRRAAALSP